MFLCVQFSSVWCLIRVWIFVTPWTEARQASLSTPTPGVYSNSCPLSWWCHPTISSSVVPFSSYLQSFPASESFPMSQFFTSGGQSIGVSALASVSFSRSIQDWYPLGWTGWISLQSKRLWRVFFNTTVQKHQFFGTQLSFIVQLSHPYMTTGKAITLTRWTFVGKVMYLWIGKFVSLKTCSWVCNSSFWLFVVVVRIFYGKTAMVASSGFLVVSSFSSWSVGTVNCWLLDGFS